MLYSMSSINYFGKLSKLKNIFFIAYFKLFETLKKKTENKGDGEFSNS